MMSDKNKDIMCADYKICSGWGNSIAWSDATEFETNWNENSVFRVHGWQSKIPKVGQTLLGEFNTTWTKFEFVEVERCGDPRDMFFAKVKPVDQEMKHLVKEDTICHLI
jgi:hypothetical protein